MEFRDDTLRKELENANKQITFYQKEIEKLKYKIDSTHTHDRYGMGFGWASNFFV